MSGYTRVVEASTKFDGREVEYTFKRLTRIEFLEVSSFITTGEAVKNKEGKKEVDVQVVKGKEADFLSHICKLIPNKLVSVSGLIVDGEEKNYTKAVKEVWEEFEEIAQDMYFTTLMQDITGKIMLESQGPSGDVEKKSEDTPSE